jgi:alpha-L-rhamnosidase
MCLKLSSIAILLLGSSAFSFAQVAPSESPAVRPWQQITVPTVGEAAANFKSPPREYGAIQPFASWNGADPAEVRTRISRDFDRLSANGIFIVNLSPGRRAPGEGKYLSPEHMDQVRFTVQEAAKRNMRLWIQDESDYPSGFAGGYISERYPQLGMQDIVADIQVNVAPGQTLTMPVPSDTLSIMALESDVRQTVQKVIPIPLPADLQLKWSVPNEGSTPNEPRMSWQVVFVRHVYLSSPTRNFNRADGTRAKDATYSIIDYLDPKATDAFLSTVHETYRKAVGDQFGKIVLGFFGDEPDYSNGIPWTPSLLEQFKTQKGYDLSPYIPLWFSHKPTEQSQRANADYYDVWSGIFRSSYFGEQAAWAKKYNVEYLVHLNHEETMTALEHSEGDYFRDNRYVQVPGIDNLGQLVPGAMHLPDGTWNINNNFPKLASSAAHLFGRPQVWAEEGGGVGVDGKYQMDFQLVRGVNALEIRTPILRGGGAVDPPNAVPAAIPPQASLIAWYANRGGYLMAIGRPAAQVGLYHPGNSIWLGGTDAQQADRSTTKLGWQLLQHQVDWDYFDEQSLSSVASIEDGGFKNLSGQVYKAIVFPSMTVITRTGLERLRAYVTAGGKAIFVGQTPRLVLDKTFLDAKEVPDLSFATLVETAGDITPRVLEALPAPDVKLNAEWARLTYTHRVWRDGDMYFFFNESNATESRLASLKGHGQAQSWDLATGEVHPMVDTAVEGNMIRVPLVLGPYEAKVIVVGPLPKGASPAEPSFASGEKLAELDGDWTLDLNGKQLTTPLKSWEELGTSSFTGTATYRKQFTAPSVAAKKHIYLEISDAHDYAHVLLNGKDLGAHAWQPYRWDITGALKSGMNNLEIQVNAPPASRPVGAPPPAAAPAATANPSARRPRQDAPAAPATTLAGTPRAPETPPVSGLQGPIRLVAY